MKASARFPRWLQFGCLFTVLAPLLFGVWFVWNVTNFFDALWGGNKAIAKALSPIPSADTLKKHVQALTQTKLPRNASNTMILDQVASYIREQWKQMGLKPEDQPFRVDGATYRNIKVRLGPKKGDLVVVGAHYDVCGEQDGADDNASGVAGLLELSRLLVKHKPALRYPVELVAYTLEEPPHFRSKDMGSAVHAHSLAQAGVKVRAMLALEMIGYFSDKVGSQRFPTSFLRMLYPNKGNFIAVVSRLHKPDRLLTKEVLALMKQSSALPAYRLNAPSSLPGVDFSDHLNYWRFQYPALMITDTAFFRNPHYHKPTDTIGTLDFARMAQVVQGVYGAVIGLR
ncbi:MAG: M28 family peptidase [Myxococcales bacterium]|nr:M28 family peptidase [Myxococcales bacterium]